MASTTSFSPTQSPNSTAPRRRIRFLIPVILLVLVGVVVAWVLLSAPRTPPTLLGASSPVDGGLARIQGVIPTEVDGWVPPPSSAVGSAVGSGVDSGVDPGVLAGPAGEGVHRVRILVELTAMEADGLVFDPSEYAVSALGEGTWEPVWFSPAPATAVQGQTIDATLVFELPDRAIDLTLDLPGGPGLSLGEGHHRE
jgi:hypothetical protein